MSCGKANDAQAISHVSILSTYENEMAFMLLSGKMLSHYTNPFPQLERFSAMQGYN